MVRYALLPLVFLPAFGAGMPPEVRTLFTTQCLKCHNASSAISGLDLSTRPAALKGGKQGPDLITGDAAQSRLYQFVAQGKMPPGGKVDPATLTALRSWIDGGAPWAESETLTAPQTRSDKNWWAYQPPRKSPVPAIDGVTNPIDAFIAAKLRAAGLDFAPSADRRTLLRRASFALTGLPPAVEKMHETLPEAVERLLASPQYGERWGRYWLDVVRFGETDGGEHNFERFNAWPYRDYVIAAFNQDKPYPQFIREQLAGDVLAPGDPKLVAATGFLTAGPWDSVSAVLNKDLTMKKVARMDELDDMVTTTAATFLGLTVNCARCHDHKFDPIPARDYYRLAAVFNGVGFGNREVATPEAKAAREAQVAPIRKELEAARKAFAAINDPVKTRLLRARYVAYEQAHDADARRMAVNPIWNRNRFAPVAARHFRFVTLDHSGKAKERLEWLQLLPAGRTASGPSAVIDFDTPTAVSEIRFASDPTNGSTDGAVKVYRFEASDDGQTWRTVCSSLDHVSGVEFELPQVTEAEIEAALSEDLRAERRALAGTIARLQRQIEAIPALPTFHAAVPLDVTPSYLLERGSVLKPLEEVTPGGLTALAAYGAELPLDNPKDGGARRLAMANWIADPRNPLTARVIVNRVWYAHFGNGIVNTPSDFGFNGDRPSHPELLDWLAVSFIENGWSIKWLQRQILGSRTWQQSAAYNEKAHAMDAGNRLLWHMPLRRMDAEMLRDSLLAVTGNLNLAGGGPSFLLQKKGSGGSYIYSALDNDGPEVWRRAVYRFVVRGGDRIMLDSFDCPDPSVATPQRSVSNTPVQALTLMNNAFVLRQAELLAQRLQKESPAAPVERAYQLLFQRDPSPKEKALAARFLQTESLAAYCRVLLNSNEFVYVP